MFTVFRVQSIWPPSKDGICLTGLGDADSCCSSMGGAHASAHSTCPFPNTDKKESFQVSFNKKVHHQRSLVLFPISKNII